MAGRREYRREETGARFPSEDFVEVRALVSGCSASLIFQLSPLISNSGFLLLRLITGRFVRVSSWSLGCPDWTLVIRHGGKCLSPTVPPAGYFFICFWKKIIFGGWEEGTVSFMKTKTRVVVAKDWGDREMTISFSVAKGKDLCRLIVEVNVQPETA